MSKRATRRSQPSSLSERVARELSEIVISKLRSYVENRIIDISTHSLDKDVLTLVGEYKSGRYVVNPLMKREYSWSKYTASKYIETVYFYSPAPPIPPILTIEISPSKVLIIDGFHRVETLRMYLDNEFMPTKVIEPINRKLYKNLADDDKAKINRARIREITIIVRKLSPDLSDDEFRNILNMIALEVFMSINVGAKPLKLPQIMFCGVLTDSISAIRELADSDSFMKIVSPLTDSERRNMSHRMSLLYFATCVLHNKPIAVVSAGKIRHISEIESLVFVRDRKKLEELKTKLSETINLASQIGFSRDMFVPASYGVKNVPRISPALLLIGLWVLYKIGIVEGKKVKLLEKKKEVVDVVKSKFKEILTDPRLKELYREVQTEGSQDALTKLVELVESEVRKLVS